jgi:hypothetical protein
LVVPVELARRERVLIAGEEEAALTDMGEDGACVKLALCAIRVVPVRMSEGIERRFSSVDASKASEREDSTTDMDTVRPAAGRGAVAVMGEEQIN